MKKINKARSLNSKQNLDFRCHKMKNFAWIFSLILCLATFLISPSALADASSASIKAPPVIADASSASIKAPPVIEETGEIWKVSSPTFTAQGGSIYHGSYVDPKIWTLLEGSGERKFLSHIYFEEPYQTPPTVIVSLTGMDVDNAANERITAKPINITETGFDLQLKTWANSRIVSIWSDWVAFGNND